MAKGWIALALVIGLATACRGAATTDTDPTVTTVATAPDTSGPGTATPTGGDGDALPIPGVSGPIAAGRYHTTVMRPALELELGDGWSVSGLETEQAVTFIHGQDAERVVFALARPQRVIDPQATLDADGELPDEARLPLPDDLVVWFQEHPLLETGEPIATMFGGVPATRIDLTVGEIAEPTCGPRCAMMFATEQQDYAVAEGMVIRSYVLEVEGETLAIGVLVSNPAAADAGFALGDDVVASLEFSDE